jgi:hypothetical protein
MEYTMPRHSSHFRSAAVAACTLALLGSAACTSRPVQTTSAGAVDERMSQPMTTPAEMSVDQIVSGWSEKQREAATMMMTKYGQPDVKSDRLLVWYDKGSYAKIALSRNATQHNFPMPHPDFLTHTVKHTVPLDKLDELAQYDGSVWFHRTTGELSAQCDTEAHNNLALNLAHEVMTGKRTVEDARMMYGKVAKESMQGNMSSPYLTGLMFQTEPSAADPDQALPMPNME